MSCAQLALFLVALLLPTCQGKCRKVPPNERPLTKCVLYRHKEDLPLDAAPFFDLHAEGQLPDTFVELDLQTKLHFHAPLFEAENIDMLTLEHQICLAAASDTCSFLDPFGKMGSTPTVHSGLSPQTATDRPYLPDASILKGRGVMYAERAPTYDNFQPTTTFQEEHFDGFWTDYA